MKLSTRLLLLALTVLPQWGCEILSPGDGRDPTAELARNRARWEAEGLLDYRLTQSWSCECIPGFVGPAVLTVTGGAIASVEEEASGNPVPEEDWTGFRTVEGLFELIGELIAQEPVHLQVDYDPSLGFPVRIDVDVSRDFVDDEMVIRVRDLQPQS